MVALLSVLEPPILHACRYSVRDIAFVNFETDNWHLYCCVGDDTPSEVVSVLRQSAYASLIDSNIEVEMVNLDSSPEHPVTRYVAGWAVESSPVALLVARDGRSMLVQIPETGAYFAANVWAVFEGVVSSPVRKSIRESIIDSYAVVLLVEGPDIDENERARKETDKAIGLITELMPRMAKPVEGPPQLVTVPYDSREQERVLLWSLGVLGNEPDAASIVLLHGRGRRIGPVIRGERIAADILLGMLSVVGADCECGLDLTWSYGPMIPMAWGHDDRRYAAKTLGFDPESPIVKVEVSQILARGSLTEAQMVEGSGPSIPGSAGYSEEVLQLENDGNDMNTMSPAQIQTMMSAEQSEAAATGLSVRVNDPADTNHVHDERSNALRKSFAVLLALGVLVVVVGIAALAALRHAAEGAS